MLPEQLSPRKAMMVPFLLGPCVLTLMYFGLIWVHSPYTLRRGLFEFYSATWGDFVILPITWFLMSKYYHDLPKECSPSKNLSRIVFVYVIGFLVSIIITIVGIMGPYRDWTLPERGRINFVGLYHSFFMGFMISTYLKFYLDHASLMKRLCLSKEHLQTFWAILDLLTLFMIFLWLDGLYYGCVLNWFQSMYLVLWGIFLVYHYWLSIRYRLYPYRLHVWAVKQVGVYVVISLIGVVLSGHLCGG